MEKSSETSLAQAREFLKNAQISKAHQVLEERLPYELQNDELRQTLTYVHYWEDFILKLQELESPFERGESLILRWKQFSAQYCEAPGSTPYEQSIDALRQGIFQLALENYQSLFQLSNQDQKAEILRKTGLCYKALGDYEKALKYLNEANSLAPGSAPVLAEMADCYALYGEERIAKVLFREAFFVDAEKVDITLLESELITTLISYVENMGYTGSELKSWIPVYGVLYGVFNIKRELRALEAGKLKQSVFQLENELKEARGNASLLKPRLINHYFWLVDYYVNTNDDHARINEILLKIKLLDPVVHDKYVV